MAGEMRTAIGLMSGTSLDGIDVAIIQSDGQFQLETGPFESFAYTPQMVGKLKDALNIAKQHITERQQRPSPIDEIEYELTKYHAEAVEAFMANHDLRLSDIDLIGFHGQTILHQPHNALTVQIGDGQQLANLTKIPVIYDMRAKDVALGGQGAPLAPVYHRALAQNFPKNLADKYKQKWPICFVNIGGISNVTIIDQNQNITAFDCGPGNVLIDQWVETHTGQPFDKGGALAAKGQSDPAIINEYTSAINAQMQGRNHTKISMDRLQFAPLAKGRLSLENGARTLAELTATMIAKAGQHSDIFPKLWIVSGGGRHNCVIMQIFGELLDQHHAIAISSDALNWRGDAIEAQAWAYLAIRAHYEIPLSYPATTGISHPSSGGIKANPRRQVVK